MKRVRLKTLSHVQSSGFAALPPPVRKACGFPSPLDYLFSERLRLDQTYRKGAASKHLNQSIGKSQTFRTATRQRRSIAAFGLLIVAFSLILLTACGSRTASESNQSVASAKPQRIISFSPSVTEILYGVGAFPRVVAVSDYCDYPPEVKNLPRVGGWKNINLEQIAALKPDLIVMTDAEAPLVRDRLDAMKIKTLVAPSRTVDDALRAIEIIGQTTGDERQGAQLAAQTRAQLEEIKSRTKDLKRPRVLCVVDRTPGTLKDIYTATQGSFLAQVIEIAGGESIAPPAAQGYGKISKEAIVSLDPDIIIDMVQGQQGSFAENPAEVWNELNTVRAVRENRIYPMREMSVLHPSQFVAQTARRFAEIIHPEIFKSVTAVNGSTAVGN